MLHKAYSSADELPADCIPIFLKTRESTVIPTPAFDLAKQKIANYLSTSIEKKWKNVEDSSSLFIAHALSLRSQRRVLEAYFYNAKELTAEQLIYFSPYTTLAVRQLISGSLIDLHSRNIHAIVTRNGGGLLFRVPSACLYTVSITDANVPREQEGVSQNAFRTSLFSKRNNTGFTWSPISLTPKALLSNTLMRSSASYNEVAFIPRTLNPASTGHLAGIFINPNILDFGSQIEKGDPTCSDFYFKTFSNLAKKLDLPLINFCTNKNCANQ